MNKYNEFFEILILQMIYTLLFHVGNYTWDKLDILSNSYKYGLIFLFITILLINSFIRLLKNKKIINTNIFLIHILLAIINLLSIHYLLINDMGLFSGLDLTIVLSIGWSILIIGYLLIFNLSLSLYNKKNKVEIVKEKLKYNITSILLLLIAATFPFAYGIFANKVNKDIIYKNANTYVSDIYKDEKIKLSKDICTNDYCYFDFRIGDLILVKASSTRDDLKTEYKTIYDNKYYYNKVIFYLNNKFKKDKFVVDEKDSRCGKYSCTVKVKSELLNEIFDIYIGTYEESEISELDIDELEYKYLSRLANRNIDYYSDLIDYFDELETKLEDNISKKYNVDIDLNLNLARNDNWDYLYQTVDITEINNIKELITIDFNTLHIHKIFNKDQEEEFSKYIINIYEDITNEYVVDLAETMFFEFDYVNPFRDPESEFYTDGGYLRDGKNIYYLYLRAHPLKINK